MKPRSTYAFAPLFAALTAVLGLIPPITLPLGVPITPQTLGVMLAGCLLGPRRGFQSMLLLLAAVALGMPLLSGGRGGIGVFAAPSSGYLIGWPIGAFVTGWVMAVLPSNSPQRVAISAFASSLFGGLLVIHACGVLGLIYIARLSPEQAVLATLAFVPGDLLKCCLAAMIAHTVSRGLPDWRFGGRETA